MSDSAIYAHRLFLRAGLSLANAFLWIFVFQYFYVFSGDGVRAFAATALLYVVAQLVTFIATPISAAHLRRGTRHSLIWGVLCAAAAFVFLGGTLVGYFDDPPFWGLVVFALFFGLYRALYWIPYKLLSTEIHPHLHMRAYFEVLIALMPLFAGLTLASSYLGHLSLLFGAATLIALSALPVLFLDDTRERFSWTLHYTFAQLLRHKNHGLVLQGLFEGFQGAALFFVWPLAIFLIIGWSYLILGLVFTLTLLLILLLRRLYSWMLDAANLRHSMTVQTVVTVTGWVARLAAGTPVGIIVADVYAHTTSPREGTHTDPFLFEQSSDRGAFLDEYTALKEMSLALGRIMACVISFLLAFIFPLPVVLAFVLGIAALASALSYFLARKGVRPAY